MVEWQKLVVKTIGDDVSGNFASNVSNATLSDDFSSYSTQALANGKWIPIGVTNSIIVDIAANLLDWDFVVINNNRQCQYDLFEAGKFSTALTLSGNWAIRWQMNFGSGLVDPAASFNEGFFGMFSGDTVASDLAQDFIALSFRMTNGSPRSISLVTGENIDPNTPTTTTAFTYIWSDDETIYCELKRTSTTTAEATLYSDADYSIILEKIKVTGIAAGIEDLEFLKAMVRDDALQTGTFNGTIGQVELFNESEGLQDFMTAKGNDKALTYDVIPDLITGQNTPDFTANLFVTTGWVDAGTSEIFQEEDKGQITCLVDADGGNDGIANDILGGTVSDTSWVLRGDINIANFAGLNATPKRLFIGMFSANQIASANQAQDGIFFVINSDNTFSTNKTGTVALYHSDGITPQSASIDASFDYDIFQPMREGRFFWELKRTSSTTVECTFFDERGFDFPLQTVSATIPATVTGLRYLKLNSSIASAAGRTTATCLQFDFWDGVTNSCTFNTATVLEQDTAQAVMNYCNANIFYTGIEDNTNNAISVDLGATLSDSSFVLRCKIDVVDNNVTASNAPFHWLGLTSSNSTQAGSTSQAGIALRADPVTGNYNPSHGFGTDPQSGWTNETDYTDLTITNGEFYLEIRRTLSTEVTMSLYRDELFNDLIQSRTFTISASVANLQFFKIMNRVSTASTAFWEIIVTNIQIWDSVDNVDGFAGFRSLDIQTKCNQLNGIIRAGYIMNSHDESGDYTRITSLNNAADSSVTTNRFLDVQGTPSASDVYSFLVIFNRAGNAFNGQPLDKQTHGYDTVQANTFGPANVPDRIECVGAINMAQEINKIEVSNDQAGIYDTDSEIAVFGTD